MKIDLTREELGAIAEGLDAYLDAMMDTKQNADWPSAEPGEEQELDEEIAHTEAAIRKVTEALIG